MSTYKKIGLCLFSFLMFLINIQLVANDFDLSKDPLMRLMEGNKRYTSGEAICHPDWSAKRASLLKKQSPFAVVLCCSDSRVPPEIIFDQTLGDLFVVRLAGNIIDDFAIGSIEYAVENLGSTLVMVLGHEGCGAVDATLKGAKPNNHIREIISAIEPAVASVRGESGDPLENAVKANVRRMIAKIKASAPVLKQRVENKALSVFGGYYMLDTGEVQIVE